MPVIAREDIARRIQQGEGIGDIFLVSGLVINGPNGPQRWSESFSAPSARAAEDEAREMMSWECHNGRYGRLWVCNVFQLGEDGWFVAVDGYAFFADDPDRPEGFLPEGGWEPPTGWDGTEGRRKVMPAMHDPRIYPQ